MLVVRFLQLILSILNEWLLFGYVSMGAKLRKWKAKKWESFAMKENLLLLLLI